MAVVLRQVTDEDVEQFFAHRRARGIASASEHPGFIARWQLQRADPSVCVRTIAVAAEVIGYIAQFSRGERPEVCYELGPQFWGQGYATAALRLLLQQIALRPLYARVAQDNHPSIRVLLKNGFMPAGEDRYLTNAGVDLEEFVFVLDSAAPGANG